MIQIKSGPSITIESNWDRSESQRCRVVELLAGSLNSSVSLGRGAHRSPCWDTRPENAVSPLLNSYIRAEQRQSGGLLLKGEFGMAGVQSCLW